MLEGGIIEPALKAQKAATLVNNKKTRHFHKCPDIKELEKGLEPLTSSFYR
jgi:hypothetical protein